MDDRAPGGTARSSWRSVPPSAGSTPARHSNSVVFPDPFGPIRPRISPGRIENDTSLNAVRFP
jgi:hypothetical protein